MVSAPEPLPPAAPAPDRGGPTWMSLLMWLLGSLGLTGALVTCGFILNTGSEDFWGYHLSRDLAPADYVTLFGELVSAGFSGTLQWAGESWWHLPLALGAGAACVVLLVRLPDRHYSPRMLFLGLGVLALANVAWTDVPSFFVRDMLIDLGSSGAQSADGMVGDRAAALRERHVCSRLTETQVTANADAGLEVTCTARPARYRQALRNAFILNLMLGLVNLLALAAGAMWLLSGGGRELARTRAGRTWRLVLASASAVLLMDVVNVPYHYAKTVRSTQVQKAVLVVSDNDSIPTVDGFVLSDGKDRMVLYNEDSWDIWILPQNAVKTAILRDPEDVLRYHIQHRLEESQ
jgi:hypothetical protein